MDAEEMRRIYPKFNAIVLPERQIIIPNISLPLNFRELVPRFYSSRGKEKIEDYVNELKKITSGTHLEFETRLFWDELRGLKNIGVGMQGGLDLEERGGEAYFQEHNLGIYTGYLAGIIAIQYVSTLLWSTKQNPQTI